MIILKILYFNNGNYYKNIINIIPFNIIFNKNIYKCVLILYLQLKTGEMLFDNINVLN